MLVIAGIDCADALRDGPIDGVTEQYIERVDETGVTRQDLSGCLASTQAAVRQAARQALIEEFDVAPAMLDRDLARLLADLEGHGLLAIRRG